MSSLSVFMKNFLANDEAKPGRLVTNLENPAYQYYTKEVLHLTDSDISKRSYVNVEALTKAHSSNIFQASLTKLLSVFAKQSKDSVERIKAQKAYSYNLMNVPDKLHLLVGDDDVKQWLEQVNQHLPVYMIVAVHTVESATVGQDAQSSKDAGGALKLPLAEAAMPGSSATPVGQALDVSGAVNHDRRQETSFAFVAPNERIIAVGYQKVVLKTLLGERKQTPELGSKAIWRSFSASRATGDGPSMVEASVCPASTSDLKKKISVEATSLTEDTVHGELVRAQRVTIELKI
ncbi:hypothetical protein LTR56_005868 [Elasticomyces elasticus]|nr:hypothetical protein LTR56_005868 [Elasticomyces elasticus]KAK3664906.1 hypothetical protein LTR22_004212 [Elasticomyces elasticus]KAK5756432.1 hypothetical protein LTS12_013504 [Elasticomyces elasticus]